MNPLLKVREERKTPLCVSLEVAPRLYEFGDVKARRAKLRKRLTSIVEQLGELVAGFEVGLPMIVALDPLSIAELIERTKSRHGNLLFLARCRVVDFDYSNRILASHIFELGFDGVITQVFTGYSGSLDGILEEASARGRCVLGTVILGNPGAGKLFNAHYKDMVSLCNRLKLDGVEVAGSVLEAVRSVKSLIPRGTALVCSSVMPSKLTVKKLVLAGADLVILGRGILVRPSPASLLTEILREVRGSRR